MTANSLSASYTDIQKEVGLALGWHRTPASWSANQDADFERIISHGARQFYYPPILPGEGVSHDWSFLSPLGELELSASYSTGTIAVASGVVTLSSGTFPSWAAQGDLWYQGDDDKDKRLTVNTRDSNTQITLDDTSGDHDAAASTTYTLRRHYYDLPDDFGGLRSDSFQYRRDQQWNFRPFRRVSDSHLRQLDHEQNVGDHPYLFALIAIPPTTTQSSRWKVEFYPLADSTYFVEYRYRAIPPDLDGSTHVYHYGGAEHSETFIASCVDQAFQILRDSNEKHGYFMERLAVSVRHDSRQYLPDFLGKAVKSLGDYTDRNLLREFRQNTNPANITLNFG